MAAVLALCAAGVVGLFLLLGGRVPETVEIGGVSYSLHAQDEAQVTAFLEACGFVPQGCVSDRTITVPKHWNDVYAAYDALQREQGFALAPYKGKEARELVYASAAGEQYATVLVCGGRIIAAHQSTMQYGDELHPLIG